MSQGITSNPDADPMEIAMHVGRAFLLGGILITACTSYLIIVSHAQLMNHFFSASHWKWFLCCVWGRIHALWSGPWKLHSGI